jgi:C-terminal peptidase prc
MSQGQLHVVVRHLRRLVGEGSAEPTDRQLLARFAAGRDEAAFAALVERHGPLVWGVCRRALRHAEDAEDAFQATFLVLARRAAAVGWRESVHNWLYEVASRLAAEVRRKAARRRFHEARAARRAPAEALPDEAGRELGAVLDEELRCLPARYRAPLLLCYLEGKTSDQAARDLGWSLRTLERRLAQGRALLRQRLTRRGITLSAALLAPALSRGAAVRALLTVRTIKAAVSFAAGASGAPAGAAAMAQGVLRGMLMTRLKIAAAVLLVLGTLTGAGALVQHALAAPGGDPEPRAREAPAAAKGGGGAREAPAAPVAFAHRLWEVMDLVREKHPEPPARGDMILAAAKALFQAAKSEPPDDLERRAGRVKTRQQLADFLREVWPAGAQAPAEDLRLAALEGLFAAVPGQGAFLPPEEVRVQEQISGNRYVGTGIQIRVHPTEKMPQIVTPFKGGPADRGGIKRDDLIVEVNGKATRDVPLRTVVDWLRGDEGTTLVVAVRQPGASETRTVKMTRSVVPFETVMGHRRAGEEGWDYRIDPQAPIGYVRLSGMRSSAPHELRRIERRLRAEGARALVLDVRFSRGDSDLHNAALVAGALLDGGLMWRVQGADKQVQEFRAGRECLFRDWPLVVLINDHMGSPEGAVAAALQDNGRAVLVGEASRSAGYVTSVLPLSGGQGALSFRTGRLERPARDRGWPLQPDHLVPMTKEQQQALQTWWFAQERGAPPEQPADKPAADPQLGKAVELLRAALKKADEGR